MATTRHNPQDPKDSVGILSLCFSVSELFLVAQVASTQSRQLSSLLSQMSDITPAPISVTVHAVSPFIVVFSDPRFPILSLQGYPGGGNPPPGAPYGAGRGSYGSSPSAPYGGAAGQAGGPYGGYGVPGHGGQYGPGPGRAPGGPYGGYGGQPYGGPNSNYGPAGNSGLRADPF